MATTKPDASAPTSTAGSLEPARSPGADGLPRSSLATRASQAWRADVDPASLSATWMLIYLCFLTGFTSAVTFSACFIWCGFQTGGVAQLGLAVARNFAPREARTYVFEKPDQQALTSLLSFLLGTSLGRIGDRWGCKRRGWLATSSVIQAVLLTAAAVLAHYSGEPSVALSRYDPSWRSPMAMAALGFASATLGLQGIVGKRLNTPFGTAVVLTTIWVELINEPKLFILKRNKARDLRAASVFFLFLGALIGRALIDVIGSGGTFAVGVGLRVVQAAAWFWVASPRTSEKVGLVR